MSAIDRLTRHQHEGLVLDADETRALIAHIAELQKQRDELLGALKFARDELYGLPHSLGYSFTHIPQIDAAITNATGA